MTGSNGHYKGSINLYQQSGTTAGQCDPKVGVAQIAITIAANRGLGQRQPHRERLPGMQTADLDQTGLEPEAATRPTAVASQSCRIWRVWPRGQDLADVLAPAYQRIAES